jgi:hypothetical protein
MINAIETLFPEREGHTCPACERFHDSPGPTARFRAFVETYAAGEEFEARDAVYNLRSTLVHGLHGLDTPRSWGALEPGVEEHRSLHDAAVAVARTAIRKWFLEHASASG